MQSAYKALRFTHDPDSLDWAPASRAITQPRPSPRAHESSTTGIEYAFVGPTPRSSHEALPRRGQEDTPMTLTRVALTLSLCLLPCLAHAQDAFPGRYELTGKYSNRRATQVELSIRKVPGAGILVSRKGTFTSYRHRNTPPVHWHSANTRLSDSGRVLFVTYKTGPLADVSGMINAMDPDSITRDDAVAAMTQRNVFKGLYFLSADGQTVREVVTNTTRLNSDRWWRWCGTEGGRAQAPAVTTLTPSQYLDIRDGTLKDWYLEDTRDYYDNELANPNLTADERRGLEEDRDYDMDFSNNEIMSGDWWFDEQIEDRYYGSDPSQHNPYLDADGRAIPKDALDAVTLSMYPEHAGIGLSKAFLFDMRTGEVIDEGDLMD